MTKAGIAMARRPIHHRDAELPGMIPAAAALGAAVLLSADVSVTVDEASAVSVVVAGTVVVTMLEVWVVATRDVTVRVSFARDPVAAKIPVKLAVATDASDRTDASSEATRELAPDTTAPADSVAAAMTELARATLLLASEAASETALAAAELALRSTLLTSDSLAEMAAETDAARVKRSDSALLAMEAAMVGRGMGTKATPSDVNAAAEDAAADSTAPACEMAELTETLITAAAVSV